jgi:hypothetical protein
MPEYGKYGKQPILTVSQDDTGRFQATIKNAVGAAIVGRGASFLEAVGEWAIQSGYLVAFGSPPCILREYSISTNYRDLDFKPSPTREWELKMDENEIVRLQEEYQGTGIYIARSKREPYVTFIIEPWTQSSSPPAPKVKCLWQVKWGEYQFGRGFARSYKEAGMMLSRQADLFDKELQFSQEI